MIHNKEDYNNLIKLYMHQEWLITKKVEMYDLLGICDTSVHKNLIFSLLERFYYLNGEKLNYLYNEICDYIINESGFDENSTQLLSLTYDDEADSSQRIIDSIKVPLYKAGWKNFKTVNLFGKGVSNYKKGKNQILIIDEFIGSGSTLSTRLDWLKKNIIGDFELKCCFLAGIKSSVDILRNKGIEIFCPLELDKGISEFYKGNELIEMEKAMQSMESKLAEKINEKELSEYSFGYGNAQALYSMEGCQGNTPNSVFPIFWWTKDKNDSERKTILTRYETGF
ncbi:phosphoribosyltransferase-like protein [Flavobacterium sp. C4GT6]|uniref:phosphoribosyltransferase-like protein n=1 Tax=Flavobacterium sp. C4GT6 TaxID=3103818 RepID=UPI002ED20B69